MPVRAQVDPLTGLEAARFGVYLHFPWCLSKCPYCDFASIVSRRIPEERYTDALLRELQLRLAEAPALEGREVESIFVGGGTPSLWAPGLLRRVLGALRAALRVSAEAEISLEANPGAADAERFAALREAGINRLSIGVQSFQPSTLAALGRSHDGPAAERAYRAARAAGFDNVSLDFIYGVHGQTLQQARDDAHRAAALGADHLSAYALTLDRASLAEEVPLARQLARGEVSLPPDEAVLEMREAIGAAYAGGGLERYEISNYARPGRHSRHNALYWTGGEYLALGAGATGFLLSPEGGGVRYANARSAEQYFAAVEDGRLPETSREALGPDELFAERVAMGLRLAAGVDLEAACARYGRPWATRSRVVDALVSSGLAVSEGRRLRLTSRGADVHSAIAARLI